MSYAADDTEAIARRLKEIEAEKQVALTGSSAPVTGQEPKAEPDDPYGYGMAGWMTVSGVQTYVTNGVNVTTGGVPYLTTDPLALRILYQAAKDNAALTSKPVFGSMRVTIDPTQMQTGPYDPA